MIDVGHHTSINGSNTDIYASINKVIIEPYTSIARNVTVQEFNHNYNTITSYSVLQNVFGEKKRQDIYSNGDIIIGNDVWIGTHCVILSSAKINDGVIVAANSVVTGEIPSYSIVAGSPARVIKYRFDDETIQLLLELK